MYDPISEFNLNIFKEHVNYNELIFKTILTYYDGLITGFVMYDNVEYYCEIEDSSEYYTLYNVTIFDKIKIISFNLK
jgi:hypothetical protein